MRSLSRSCTSYAHATTFQICSSSRFVLWLSSSPKTVQKMPGDVMANAVERKGPKHTKKSWWWPAGMATSLAGAAVVAFRGCWHRKMSWPIGMQGYSYQVCLSCGVKRLFDEATFSAYGPFRYDVQELVKANPTSAVKSRPIAEMRRPAE